jgi:hypothetical protein
MNDREMNVCQPECLLTELWDASTFGETGASTRDLLGAKGKCRRCARRSKSGIDGNDIRQDHCADSNEDDRQHRHRNQRYGVHTSREQDP